ncbi:cell division protein FtsQ [Lutibacter sp. TH_r2]|uniref:cell division protein FtsQ/DivIB n=1 Tax=Lutibacter sp. TH_r2 TaxID=3082083 RepID=UPI002954E701|nr:cell division protein FtsQ [Lutibacter sp. TH_r2]MDV7187021.1 cell division protein FtsQ [Lutibacter sp. TH_r2]
MKDIQVNFEEGELLFMDYQMVNKLLIQNEQSVKNKAKSVIDLHLLESNILAHPMVENASVYLTVDGLLKASVKQRIPIARVFTNNKSYYIDRQAKIMPLSHKHSARVIVVSGEVSEKNTAEVFELVSTILEDNFLKKQIVGIQRSKQNEYVLNTRVGEQKIILGSLDNLNSKFKDLKSFYSKAMLDSTLNKYTTINLKYNHQVVCTKK